MARRKYYPKASSKRNNRTVFLNIRLTAEEDAYIRKHATKFGSSISHYIRSAISEFSNPHKKEVIGFIDDLYSFYFDDLSGISLSGYYLNKSVKRVNELAKTGRLTDEDIKHDPLSHIKSLQFFLTTVKNDLDAVIENAKNKGIRIK